ncbi:uncharacterized protein [Ptychodera flava]|uniref:uncharacterized protein n=1 Tax=Ptychodera flava TaxID=63121 RepID=UPI00396AB061
MDKVPLDEHVPEKNAKPPVKSSTLVAIAFTQTLLGGVLIYAGTVAVKTECYFAHVGLPMYGGVLAIITGLIGIISAIWKTGNMTLTTMVLSFTSATFCAVVLVTVMAVALDAEDSWKYFERCKDSHYNYNYTCKQQVNKTVHKRQAIDTFILMMAVCEGVIAFINGILCSRVLCQCRRKKCCMQVMTSQIRSCMKGCCEDGTSCCKPTQMNVYLSPPPGSLEPSQISLKTMPTGEGNAMIVTIPTDTINGNPNLVNCGVSKDIESQEEDNDMDASESSPLLD